MSMRVMKLVLCGLALCVTEVAQAYDYSMYPYELPAGKKGAGLGCEVARKGMKLELGRWYTNFEVCKEYADEHGLPLFAIWSNHGCSHCWYTDLVLIQEKFIEWQKANNAGKVICCFMAGGYTDHDSYDQQTSPVIKSLGCNAYDWMWKKGGATLGAYPFVVMWWQKEGVNVRMVGDTFTGSTSLNQISIPGRVDTAIRNLEAAFAKWKPAPEYAGGQFADADTEGNRLEFESGTESVTVNLSRTVTPATNVTFVVKNPAGATLIEREISWNEGDTNQTEEITLTDAIKSAFTADGQKLSLYLREGDKDMATNHITFVKREPSTANPLWLGERKDPYANGIAPNLAFGEWTMDFNLATQVVAKTSGAAYTLVSIQGSMWCPDCANTDRNFLEAKDGSGKNKFCFWAKKQNVALVSMDVPNYNANGATPATVASPTLFSKKSFSTTLARAREYPASGADPSLTNAIVRSGLGYLTRKGATDEQAAAVMAKFHDLVTTNTDKGGFHRPEDTNAYRTGVPIFVLLRKDGSVAARFTRFAAVSPMAADQDNFDNFIKRFDEMLAIAATSGAHADSTEIENNYPGESAIPFAANGGTASNELCNADFQDAFKLVGVGGNADQLVTVSGASEAEVNVQFWQKKADGSFATLGSSATGKLSDGVSLTQTFTTAGDYYLLVKGANITNAEFNAASATANHFIGYEVKGATVLVPQEDRVTANAPEGSDCVTIRLAKDIIYCFSGVTTNDNPFLVEVAAAGDVRFLKSTVAGEQELKLSTGLGGEVSYQIWKPGQIAFTETSRSVPESINDENDDWVEFQIARTGGKSGSIKAKVTIDPSRTTLDPERYVFATNVLDAAEFLWEDGVTSNMTVRVKIIDDEFYDGDFLVAFNLEVVTSDAGDVEVVSGKESFLLTITEDDKSEPGRGLIRETEPAPARKGMVYVRESDGAKVWVERIEACSGLVEAEIASSVDGTTFETENPRDMTNILGRTYIYWSSRELSKKYVQVGGIPAGQSAKIQLKSVADFKVLSASNTVTIVSVADDAPEFAQSSYSFDLYRYLEAGESVKASLEPTMLNGGTVTFTKLSGTLPAGLKAVYDAAGTNLAFTGKVTAKPGTYKTVYQVVETRSGKRVPGLTAEVVFTVTDPTDLKTNPEGANPAVAKTRTFKDLPVLDNVSGRLVGLLQLTIPTKGNLSGKFVTVRGTISITAKSWDSYDPATKALGATVVNARQRVEVFARANADGSVDAVLLDEVANAQYTVSTGGQQWSAQNPAEDWKGYYTVVLPVENVVTNATADLAPTGSGYLTLNFTGKSALKSGSVKWAGMLPNGTAVSGSSVLGSPYEGQSAIEVSCNWANLPIFKVSNTDETSVYLKIRNKAEDVKAEDRRAIVAVEEITSFWKHGERASDVADYMVDLGVYGALYDKTEDLGACCLEYYQTQSLVLGFDVSSLIWTAYGEPLPILPVEVDVTKDSLIADPTGLQEIGATMSLNRSTGLVSGKLELVCDDGEERVVRSAQYKGVILTGWGEGCGCGPTQGLKTLPFVNGAFYFTDRVDQQSVKRGGAVQVDVPQL